MTSLVAIDVTAGFPGDVLPPVPVDEAASRILAYCTSNYSGWAVFDLAGISARGGPVERGHGMVAAVRKRPQWPGR
jgi:hypothetical protein